MYDKAADERVIEIGVDETGRGCLAGSVVAAAVYLRNPTIKGLADSKTLKPHAITRIAIQLHREENTSYGFGEVTAQDIDRLNILNASLHAMRLAIQDLTTKLIATGELKPNDKVNVLVDGEYLPDLDALTETPLQVSSKAIPHGDALVPSIMAASIVAKHKRDSDMRRIALEFPHFSFAAHVGYPTPQHREELRAHGPTEIHRKSFRLDYDADNASVGRRRTSTTVHNATPAPAPRRERANTIINEELPTTPRRGDVVTRERASTFDTEAPSETSSYATMTRRMTRSRARAHSLVSDVDSEAISASSTDSTRGESPVSSNSPASPVASVISSPLSVFKKVTKALRTADEPETPRSGPNSVKS